MIVHLEPGHIVAISIFIIIAILLVVDRALSKLRELYNGNDNPAFMDINELPEEDRLGIGRSHK